MAVAVKSPTASKMLSRYTSPATKNAVQWNSKPYLNGTGSVNAGRFCNTEKSTMPIASAAM